MTEKKDIRKILLYIILTMLLLVLAHQSIELASGIRYIRKPYSLTPQQFYEMEYYIEEGSFDSLIKAVKHNAVLEEVPVSDTTQQEALAWYIEAAFDYHTAMLNDRQQEAEVYYGSMQEDLGKISSYSLQKVVDEVNAVYEINEKRAVAE